MKIIVFLGPPGAGKGTQADLLAKRFGFIHIATGDIFRSHLKENTELGKRIREYLERGDLVPDEIVIDVIEDALLKAKRSSEDGVIILDGFPRTLRQAEALMELSKKLGLEVCCVLYINVSKEEVLRRLLSRGRHDDTPETIRHRFEEYERKTEPIKEYFQRMGLLIEINGEQDIESVYQEIVAKLRELNVIH